MVTLWPTIESHRCQSADCRFYDDVCHGRLFTSTIIFGRRHLTCQHYFVVLNTHTEYLSRISSSTTTPIFLYRQICCVDVIDVVDFFCICLRRRRRRHEKKKKTLPLLFFIAFWLPMDRFVIVLWIVQECGPVCVCV